MATPTLISGFETRDFQEYDATGGSPAIVTTGSRSGNCHAKFASSGDYVEHDSIGTSNVDRYWCFYIKYSGTAPSSGTMFFKIITATPTDIMGLGIGTNGKLEETIAGSTGGINVLSTGWENRIEITWSGSSDDIYRIYLNGTLEITTASSTAGVFDIRLLTDQTYDIEVDDIWIEETTTLLGDHKIVGLFPNGNGSDGWDSGGYADVDDWITTTEDDTATEALSTGSPSSATDHVQNTSVYSIGASDTINAVVAAGMLARGNGGGSEHYLRITSHTPADDDSADLGLASAYAFKSFVTTLSMPTPTQLDSWEVGGVTTGARQLEATATALMIDYSPVISTPDMPFLPQNQPYIETPEVVAY